MWRFGFYLILGWIILPGWSMDGQAAENRSPEVVFGSKKFTESVILGEIAAQLATAYQAKAEHRRELGGTRVLWSALLSGEIDSYPDYSGTLIQEIFAGQGLTAEDLPEALSRQGIRMTKPLGFNNTYVLGMQKGRADELNISKISDLQRHPELRLGFSNEFMNRADGWPGLRRYYQLPQQNVYGLDHDLAYRGLASGTLDVTDAYATDAEILYYQLRPLQDDRRFFPAYYAVYLYRAELEKRAPEAVKALRRLEGRLNDAAMRAMNAQVKLERKAEAQVAAQFIQKTFGFANVLHLPGLMRQFWKNTRDHLILVALSLSAAIVVAIPLGIAAARFKKTGQIILGLAGVMQTIPSLALFVFMIPLLGIGGPPALVALFLYSLLPIIRNTYSGLKDIPPAIRESAIALGLSESARLRWVELPLATRSILAGIKTSAVINVGTATLGALIGAGGYGQPILTGIRLDDIGLILQGAIPAAVLALLVQGVFELIERALLPKALRYPVKAP